MKHGLKNVKVKNTERRIGDVMRNYSDTSRQNRFLDGRQTRASKRVLKDSGILYQMKKLSGKTILVTGSCGTVGSELVKQLLVDETYNPDEIIGIDINESALFFQDQEYINELRAHFYVVDIRDRDALTNVMAGVDIVFHCAAMKHVISLNVHLINVSKQILMGSIT